LYIGRNWYQTILKIADTKPCTSYD